MADEKSTPENDGGRRAGEEQWYERFSWVLFIVIALGGLIPAVQLLADPLSGTSIFAGFGHPVPASILSDPNESRFLAFVFRWIGTVLVGGNLLTAFVAVTAWRDREMWAWLAMWYWPALFTAHYLMYGDGILKSLQLVWVALSILVLASNFSRFSSTPSVEGS